LISEKENETLTRVGAGTPGGELMRRYWHPIAASSELDKNPTKRVRLLGEDLVLYRDKSGTVGLIETQCKHRRVDMYYGFPQEKGIRCAYHGWQYDETGACVEQPYEQAADPNSNFHEKIQMLAYPAQELGGLVWAYLGPQPAPLLPRWEPLVRENSIRDIGVTVVDCNWLQIQENSLDPVHLEWCHWQWTNYSLEKQGLKGQNIPAPTHKKIGFDLFQHGIVKRRVVGNGSEEDDEWRRGHPIVFPNILCVGPEDTINFQFRVPIDDDHTLHFYYTVNTPGIPVEQKENPPLFDIPNPKDHENGSPKWEMLDTAPGQDLLMWVTQGPVAKRDKERLGLSDTGIILFRKLLADNIEKVQRGEDPMNTFRDPSTNVSLELHTDRDHSQRGGGPGWKYSPIQEEVLALFAEAKKAGAR